MNQDHTARADEGVEQQPQTEGFSNRPTLLADNGHGTKVKLWNNKGKNGDFQTVSVERSYKDGEEWKTQKVTLNADALLTVARGLEKGHDAIVEKQAGKQQGRGRE